MRHFLAVMGCFWLLVGCASSKPQPIDLDGRPNAVTPQAAATSPTVILKDDSGEPPVNPISSLMYFVHLISPEPVEMSESAGNSQSSRILSIKHQVEAGEFTVICDFEITGEGTQENIFDQSDAARRYADYLGEGNTLKRRLDFIKIRGAGQGYIVVEGKLVGGVPVANKLSMRFNLRGHRTPVAIGINDIRNIDGKPHRVNGQVIEVNSLVFQHQEGRPKMGVSVASIKSGNAGSGLLTNLAGRVKGAVANMFIPPVPIQAAGNNAMLDFAQAIVEGRSEFTFPAAE